ncbi:MAG: hypothetical protein R3346_01280 [Candidatus Spechtbacterales bacterium]|nr:hypothetical protein [Candidatus Spechtbacterales bacterium]
MEDEVVKTKVKHRVYVALFVFLGFLLQLVLHGGLEMFYIKLMNKNIEKYGLGLTWDTWAHIHNIFSFILILGGIWFGYKQGKYWWERIYVKKDAWFQKRKVN